MNAVMNIHTVARVFQCLLLVGLLSSVRCNPNGAPDDACVSMTPSHDGAIAQVTSSPYRITLSSDVYASSQGITVTIEGIDSFKGFLLQARQKSNGKSVGSFSNLQSDVKKACSNTAVTHNSVVAKTTVMVTWTAPADITDLGDIYFVATVVQSKSTFWTNISETINATSSATEATEMTRASETTTKSEGTSEATTKAGTMSTTTSAAGRISAPLNLTTIMMICASVGGLALLDFVLNFLLVSNAKRSQP